MKVSRRSFIFGTAASVAGASCLPYLSSCETNKTKSGLNPKDFECEGTKSLGTGLENTYTADVPIKLYTLTNSKGAELCVTNFGARIVSLMIPDRDNKLRDMVIGFKNIKEYATPNTMPLNFFGAMVGRYGNRIAKGKFSIDGKTYQVDINENGNSLHGGFYGFHFQTYKEVEVGNNSITLELVSPDGDMGFPGEFTLRVTYTLNDDNVLGIYFEANTTAPTVATILNHAFWDIAGDPNASVLDDTLTIYSHQITPVDSELIPNGTLMDVGKNGIFDFFGEKGEGKKIGRDLNIPNEQLTYGNGYDHNFVIMSNDELKARGVNFDGKFKITNDGSKELENQAKLAAKYYSDVSGITMTISTTEPAVQLFDGHNMDSTLAEKNGIKVPKNGMVALETQHFPDSPNQPSFPSCLISPGTTYKSKTEHAFSS